MQTIKLKYTAEAEASAIIREYRRQYSSVLHFVFNRRADGVSEKDTEVLASKLNNVPLIKSYLRRCAVKNASQILKARQDDEEIKVIFGSRKVFIDRAQGKISKEEFKDKRLGRLFIIGEANQYGNRLIRMSSDCRTFTFTPVRGTSMLLTVVGGYRRFKPMLERLYQLQQSKLAPITYSLDNEYLCITFDETAVCNTKVVKAVKDRIFALDLNPNYVGWSVTDWRDGNDFKVVASGVISTKEINDMDFALKGKGISSDSMVRKYLTNKRNHETLEIAKLLVNKAVHYRCGLFAIEELKIKSGDKSKGAKYNRLVNNLWNRDKFVNNLCKRCSLSGIRLMEMLPQYSSFIGNFLYRDLGLPDMVLSSIEIARRCYEFNGQYVRKDREIRKNIVKPCISDFAERYAKSSEEFGVPGEIVDMVEAYEYLKKSKCRYRLSLDCFSSLRFSRCFSWKSKLTNVIVSFDTNS